MIEEKQNELPVAIPIPKEDDLFEEFYDDLFDNQFTIKQLKAKYTITKKIV